MAIFFLFSFFKRGGREAFSKWSGVQLYIIGNMCWF